LFQGVGEKRIWDFKDLDKIPLWNRKKRAREYISHNQQVSKDYNGFVFSCATDQFMTIAYSQVL
jgi:hypothetical protein